MDTRHRETDLGRMLFELRDALGWSQTRLNRVSGVSRVTISKLETGQIEAPKMETLRRLARAFDVPVEDLLHPKGLVQQQVEPPMEAIDPQERHLLIRVRPLAMLLDRQAADWERGLAQGAEEHSFYEDALGQREPVMEVLEDLLESLTAEDGLEWDNPRHRPSRRVQRELQGAFNRWFYAWNAVNDAYKKLKGEAPRGVREMRVPTWFKRAS